MAKLGDLPLRIRSKNAGPFWITVDIFCQTRTVFERVMADLTDQRVAAFLSIPENTLRRFEIKSLNVLKFSLHRPEVQGDPADRDMHGAQLAIRLAEIELDE